MADYSIILKTTLDISDIRAQIKALQNELNKTEIKLGDSKNVVQVNDLTKAIESVSKSMDDTAKSTDNANTSMRNAELTFQAANEVFSRTLDIITSMAEQVLELDNSLTEFKKVTDLSGSSLDNYVNTLADMGSEVARTGKPKCLSLNVGMINLHYEPFKIQ